jgi:hypothetical protein
LETTVVKRFAYATVLRAGSEINRRVRASALAADGETVIPDPRQRKGSGIHFDVQPPTGERCDALRLRAPCGDKNGFPPSRE